jgi:hypothetical protein
MMRILFFSILSFVAQAQTKFQEAQDLQSQWKVLHDGKLTNYDGQLTKTVHLSIQLKKDEEFLEIRSKEKFYLFVNSSLISKSNHMLLNADSLKRKFGSTFIVSIHQREGINQLSTKWVFHKMANPYEKLIRPNRLFNDFVLMASVLLVIFFTSLLRSNPQLTLDYLDVVKLFSFKRRDDSQFVLRITSSVNLLFYFFCSLLTSLALMIAVHFSDGMSLSFKTDYSTTVGYLGVWFLLSLIIIGMMMIKLGLAAAISVLFGWRDTAGFQFFNFIRVLVISLLVIGIVSILGFSMRFNVDYYFLVKSFCAMLVLGAILMFFKLLNRESTSAFHLFSYLCATEILPLVILIKVFLF